MPKELQKLMEDKDEFILKEVGSNENRPAQSLKKLIDIDEEDVR